MKKLNTTEEHALKFLKEIVEIRKESSIESFIAFMVSAGNNESVTVSANPADMLRFILKLLTYAHSQNMTPQVLQMVSLVNSAPTNISYGDLEVAVINHISKFAEFQKEVTNA